MAPLAVTALATACCASQFSWRVTWSCVSPQNCTRSLTRRKLDCSVIPTCVGEVGFRLRSFTPTPDSGSLIAPLKTLNPLTSRGHRLKIQKKFQPA